MKPHVRFSNEFDANTQATEVSNEREWQRSFSSPIETLPSRKRTTVRWLALLFWSTLMLLIFQVLLARLASAVTLLADASHGGADVVSYGINLFVERLKLSAVAYNDYDRQLAIDS